MAWAQNRYIVTLPNVLAKASDKASPDSKDEEIDSTFWQEEMQSCIVKVWGVELVRILAMFSIYYKDYKRFWKLTNENCIKSSDRTDKLTWQCFPQGVCAT